MKKKQIIVQIILLTTFLLINLSIITTADVGPSPSYTISIKNLEEHQKYDFYSYGRLNIGKITAEQAHIYKLDTTIRIIAVQKGEILPEQAYNFNDEYVAISENFTLKAGDNIYSIKSIDTNSKSIDIELYRNTPDYDYMLNNLLNPCTIIILFAGFLIVLIIIYKFKKNSK